MQHQPALIPTEVQRQIQQLPTWHWVALSIDGLRILGSGAKIQDAVAHITANQEILIVSALPDVDMIT